MTFIEIARFRLFEQWIEIFPSFILLVNYEAILMQKYYQYVSMFTNVVQSRFLYCFLLIQKYSPKISPSPAAASNRFCNNSIRETKWMTISMPTTVFWVIGELIAFLLIVNAMIYNMTDITANVTISSIEWPTLRSNMAITRPTIGNPIFNQNEYWLVYEKYFFIFFSYGGKNSTSASFSNERYFGRSNKLIINAAIKSRYIVGSIVDRIPNNE